MLLITCSSKVTMSLDAWGWEKIEFLVVSVLWDGKKTWQRDYCLPSGRGQGKTYPHLLLHKQAANQKVHSALSNYMHRDVLLHCNDNKCSPWPSEPRWGIQWGRKWESHHDRFCVLCWKANSMKSQTVLCSVSNPQPSSWFYGFFLWCFASKQVSCQFKGDFSYRCCEPGGTMLFTHDVSEPRLPRRGLNGHHYFFFFSLEGLHCCIQAVQ